MGLEHEETRQDWDAAIRTHDHKVVLSLLALGVGPETAREVAQTTWAKLIEKDRRGELAEIALPGLAIRQARFLALDELKRRSTEDKALRVVPPPSHPPDPERAIASRQRLEHVVAALSGQPANTRTIFRLVYTPPHLSHAQTAERVGLSIQRVRQILCETRKLLRESLSEEENL